jgi:hypothetical protein
MESRKLVDFTRSPLDSVWFDSMNSGPVFNSLNFSGDSETAIGPGGYKFEIRLFNTEKRVDIVCSIVKKSITSPESFYLAFPFKLEDAVHFTELQGGVIETGKDQIKGSSNDWYSVQNFTSLRNTGTQLVMGSGEMPLMQFGAINTGRYQAGALPQGTHLFSWPMNNYWVTNFNADQRGGHTWSYYLTTSRDVSNDFATRFGWGCRVPYLTRILPGDGTGDGQREGSFISGWPANVILISARPAGTGRSVIIQLRETGGKQVSLDLSNGLTGKKLTLHEVDVLGKPVSEPDLVLNPFESGFFILDPDK